MIFLNNNIGFLRNPQAVFLEHFSDDKMIHLQPILESFLTSVTQNTKSELFDVKIEGDTLVVQTTAKFSLDGHNYWNSKKRKEVLGIVTFLIPGAQTYAQTELCGMFDFPEGKFFCY